MGIIGILHDVRQYMGGIIVLITRYDFQTKTTEQNPATCLTYHGPIHCTIPEWEINNQLVCTTHAAYERTLMLEGGGVMGSFTGMLPISMACTESTHLTAINGTIHDLSPAFECGLGERNHKTHIETESEQKGKKVEMSATGGREASPCSAGKAERSRHNIN